MESSRQTRSQTQRPPYPQQPSGSSTYQSSSSLTSLSSSMNSQTSHMMSAPLPSPSASHTQSHQYFSAQQQQPPTSHPASQQQQQTQQYVGQRGDGGGLPTTAPFLNDFNLLAEAAKRAQMVCLERDLGDIGL